MANLSSFAYGKKRKIWINSRISIYRYSFYCENGFFRPHPLRDTLQWATPLSATGALSSHTVPLHHNSGTTA